MDREAAARAIEDFLRALGHAPAGELAETPQLVAAAWCDELLDGYAVDPAEALREASLPATGAKGFVTLRDLTVTMICPHHLLVSHGHADVLYLPGESVAGLGGIARALTACTRRLTLQEDAGARMAHLLVEVLGATGAACRLRLTHTCLLARGARQPAVLESIALAGSFDGPDRQLALAVLG